MGDAAPNRKSASFTFLRAPSTESARHRVDEVARSLRRGGDSGPGLAVSVRAPDKNNRPWALRAMGKSRYKIIVRVHGIGAESGCAVLMDLLSYEGSVHRHPVLDDSACILQEASRSAVVLCQLALDAGFSLRFDLPPDSDVPGDWPLSVSSREELDSVFNQLAAHFGEELLYPFSIWGVPPERAPATHRAIEAFQSLRMDGGLFETILGQGGFRIAFFPSSITISVECETLDRTVAWVRQALEEPGGPLVSWPA